MCLFFTFIVALYARDNLGSNGSVSSSTANKKRSRFDEVGSTEELGRDSREGRSEGGYRERINEHGDRDHEKERERERSDHSKDRYSRNEGNRDREHGRDHRDRDSRGSRDSRDRDYARDHGRNTERERENVQKRHRDDKGYERDRELDRYSSRDGRGNDRHRYNDDRDRRDKYSSGSGRSGSRSIEIPFDRFLHLSPWRGTVIPLEERPRHLKNWDSAPAGFERISADKAKLTGLFPPPGNIAKTANYIPPTLDPARAAMFQLLNRDSVPSGSMISGGSALGNSGNSEAAGNIPANLLKQAKRFYIGNLPMDFSEQSLLQFLESNLRGLSGSSDKSDDYSHLNTLDNRVLNITVSSDRSYAFVECRSIDDASLAMNLDGVIFENAQLKVRRPKEYHIAVTSGVFSGKPGSGNSTTEQQSRTLTGSSTIPPVSDSARLNALVNRCQLIISGIPEILTSDHIKSLLLLVADLRSFLFLKDRETDKSLGMAVFEFVEDRNGDGEGEWSGPFLKHSNGSLFMGPFEIKIQRVCEIIESEEENEVALRNILSVYNLLPGYATASSSTPILQLFNIVTRESLLADYETIYEDLKQELLKYTNEESDSGAFELIIPKPEKDSSVMISGVGKVFVKFGRIEEAAKAASDLAGRIFDGHTCIVSFYPPERFEKRIF